MGGRAGMDILPRKREDRPIMQRLRILTGGVITALLIVVASQTVSGHGNVTPQAVDTTGLPQLGADWKTTNPYRGNATAVTIGTSGYAQNCARCHGLEMMSGGLAPDLRKLEKGDDGDAIFVERVTHGAVFNEVTKMPPFAGILSQEALWAIRTYIEANHQD
jgi:cytochrome c-550 PedF